MSVVVCDASPLIFLAKLNRLDLISEVLEGDLFVLKCVAEEVISESAGVVERKRLSNFLELAEVVDFQVPESGVSSLSLSDQTTLTWAVNEKAEWLVADERLLRRIAREHGISTVGFLGILVEGVRRGYLSPSQAKADIDDAVSRHGCRISVALYQSVLLALEER